MNQEKIGKFIKEIRKKNNLTQAELAEKYNVTYQAVSKWENGKNMPDISLIKQMSKDFNISLEEFYDGEYKNVKKDKKIYIIIILCVVISLLCVIYCLKLNGSFYFKSISTSCEDFKISGSISYNKTKSAIYITNIEYCGEEDENIYKSIDCTLYETHNDIIKKVSNESFYEKNVKLDTFLENVTFVIDNYTSSCKEYKDNELYLEIKAVNNDNKTITYKVPLSLGNSCEK